MALEAGGGRWRRRRSGRGGGARGDQPRQGEYGDDDGPPTRVHALLQIPRLRCRDPPTLGADPAPAVAQLTPAFSAALASTRATVAAPSSVRWMSAAVQMLVSVQILAAFSGTERPLIVVGVVSLVENASSRLTNVVPEALAAASIASLSPV